MEDNLSIFEKIKMGLCDRVDRWICAHNMCSDANFEIVETESSKYREWGSRAEFQRGHSVLTYLITYGLERQVFLALEHGADPNMPNGYGETPLQICMQYGTKNIFEMLLKAGADNPEGYVMEQDQNPIWAHFNKSFEVWGLQAPLIEKYLTLRRKARIELATNAQKALRKCEYEQRILNLFNLCLSALHVSNIAELEVKGEKFITENASSIHENDINFILAMNDFTDGVPTFDLETIHGSRWLRALSETLKNILNNVWRQTRPVFGTEANGCAEVILPQLLCDKNARKAIYESPDGLSRMIRLWDFYTSEEIKDKYPLPDSAYQPGACKDFDKFREEFPEIDHRVRWKDPTVKGPIYDLSEIC